MGRKPKLKAGVEKPTLSIVKPDSGPLPVRKPVRLELSMQPDDTGLKLKEVKCVFVYNYIGDDCAAGADVQVVEMDDLMRQNLEAFFNQTIDRMVEKHKTCSVGDALRLYPVRKPPHEGPRPLQK